jgi:hypothetical protein
MRTNAIVEVYARKFLSLALYGGKQSCFLTPWNGVPSIPMRNINGPTAGLVVVTVLFKMLCSVFQKSEYYSLFIPLFSVI